MKESESMKCKDCEFCRFEDHNGNPNRYHCTHPEAVRGIGYRMICRTGRHSRELKMKTSPKWCPRRKVETA